MRPNAKRILINHILANADAGFASNGDVEKPKHTGRTSAEVLCTRSANGPAALIGDDAFEIDERHDLGGEA